jgi:hypothetical protein
MRKYPFASARVIAQRFLRTVPTIKDILQRELGMRKFSPRWVLHFLSPAQKVARVEASKILLRVLNWFPKIKTTHFREFEYQFERNVCPLSTIHKVFNYGARLLLLVDAAPAPGQLSRLASPNIQHQENRCNLPSLPRPNSSNPRCSKIRCSITPSSGRPAEATPEIKQAVFELNLQHSAFSDLQIAHLITERVGMAIARTTINRL